MRDIAVNKDGDVYLGDDIAITDTTDYHKKNVLLAKSGDFKHAPEIGINIKSYINTNQTETLLRAIRRNFLNIGLDVVSLKIERGVLNEESRYEDN